MRWRVSLSASTAAGHPMPSSTRPATSGPSNVHQTAKRAMSDPESPPQDPKKARRNSSTDSPTTRRDSARDNKRRKKKKKKTPIVGAGTARDDVGQARLDSSSRVSLSAQIIRFASGPPEADLQASAPSDTKLAFSTPSPKQSGKTQASSLPIEDTSEHRSEVTSSIPRDKMRSAPMDEPVLEPSSTSLEVKVAKLEAELKSKNDLIASHHALLSQVQQAITCQVCLDLMYKPYALAPCGHIACHSCLVNWFTAPAPDNRPAPPAMMRRKTCPHCRAVVRERPVEVWNVKSIAQAVGKSGLLANQLPVPAEASQSLNANDDPWKDIFSKAGAAGHRALPWFFPGADFDDDDIHLADGAPRGEDVGMLDMEDGGIYRCLDCMHEIWDGICSSCGRVYPGHRHAGEDSDDDEYEANPMGWLEDQMGAEEVDVADDPGWMGLENGDADDDGGDIDEWRPFDPWRREFRMFRGPWGFLGTIHVDDEEEEEEDVDGRVEIVDEDEESGDEGYESSFIDDDDHRGRIGDFFDGPRFYEINDENEDHPTVDPASDDYEDEEHGGSDVAGHRCACHAVVFSSGEEADEPDEPEDDSGPSWRSQSQHQRLIVESDGSEDT